MIAKYSLARIAVASFSFLILISQYHFPAVVVLTWVHVSLIPSAFAHFGGWVLILWKMRENSSVKTKACESYLF